MRSRTRGARRGGDGRGVVQGWTGIQRRVCSSGFPKACSAAATTPSLSLAHLALRGQLHPHFLSSFPSQFNPIQSTQQ